jgi:hypothetical protein
MTSSRAAPALPLPCSLRPGVELFRIGPREFQLWDPLADLHFQLGAEERLLVDLLGRSETMAEALAGYQRITGTSVSERNVVEFAAQLRSAGLLADAPAPVPAEIAVASASKPLSSADPLANLNFGFDLLAVLFGWMLHPFCLAPVLVMTALAATAVWRHWSRFELAPFDLWQTTPPLIFVGLMLLQRLLFVNLPREVFVGVACRRFGGRVQEFTLYLWEGLIPSFRTDIGESLFLMSPRGRWTLIGLQPALPLAIGSAAVLAWEITAPGSGMAAFWVLLSIHCAVRLVAQINPFLANSYSYLALCEHWQRGGLLEAGPAEVRNWLAGRFSDEPWSAGERWWLRCYGLAYYVYRVVFDAMFLGGGGYVLVSRFGATGAFIAVALAAWWYHAHWLPWLGWPKEAGEGVRPSPISG